MGVPGRQPGVGCPLRVDDLPGARDALDLRAPNDNGYAPLVEAIARHYGVAPDRVATANGCSGAGGSRVSLRP